MDVLRDKIEELESLKYLISLKQPFPNLLRESILIRGIEEAIVALAKERQLLGPIHSYVGEEAVAVGVLATSKENDGVTSTHRGHGHYISRGGNITKLIDELHGLDTGCNGGNGGSMHVADLSKNLYGANGIVGGGVPIACGISLANKLDNSDSLIYCFFGDGASNQGVVLESFNLAAFLSLPILFICENNQFAQSTRLKDVSLTSVSDKAKGFGIKSTISNGLCLEEMYSISLEMSEYSRTKKKPSLIQADTYRFHRHFVSERRKNIDYLDEDIHSSFLEKDPLIKYSRKYAIKLEDINIVIQEIQNIVVSYSNNIKEKTK